MSKEELKVGDLVNFTSKRFNYKEKDKVWVVIEKDDKSMKLQAEPFSLQLKHLLKPTKNSSRLIFYKNKFTHAKCSEYLSNKYSRSIAIYV